MILIASAWRENRVHLREVFLEGYNLLETANVSQPLLLLMQKEWKTIFENQDAWFNIIDPDTYEVLFFNEKMHREVLGFAVGQI